jgi:HAD superfamily hydrolase (TIGR01549 family)
LDAVRWGRSWLFDLDGTLTVALHDFDAIRVELDLPRGAPLIEALDALPAADAAWRWRRIEAWEQDLAERARPAAGAEALVGRLHGEGARVGVVTRNRRHVAWRTLEVCGLDRWFRPEDVIGRDDAPPKPDPAGVRRLLSAWGSSPADAVMVGDHPHDTRAGRAAGATSILVDAHGRHPRDGEEIVVADLIAITERRWPTPTS